MKAYKPFCDFAPWAKCSKVLMSPPGLGSDGRFLRYFGIAKEGPAADGNIVEKVRGWIDVPNPTLGVIFFAVHLFYPDPSEVKLPPMALRCTDAGTPPPPAARQPALVPVRDAWLPVAPVAPAPEVKAEAILELLQSMEPMDAELMVMQNGLPACIFGTLSAFAMALVWQLEWSGLPGYQIAANADAEHVVVSFWSLFAGLLSTMVILVLWRPPGNVFLDRVCINQFNQDLKVMGIISLGAILKRSDSILVVWDENYVERLWCLFELAAFLKTHLPDEGRIQVKPVGFGSVCFLASATLSVFAVYVLFTGEICDREVVVKCVISWFGSVAEFEECDSLRAQAPILALQFVACWLWCIPSCINLAMFLARSASRVRLSCPCFEHLRDLLFTALLAAQRCNPPLLFTPIPLLGPWLPELFYLACCGVGLMTIWLAYNLIFILQDFCVVCVSMYVANFGLIPMMHALAQEGTKVLEEPFFGEVPRWFLYSLGLLDAVMGLAVLGLYLRGAHAREVEEYRSLP
eukprot:g26147.t1